MSSLCSLACVAWKQLRSRRTPGSPASELDQWRPERGPGLRCGSRPADPVRMQTSRERYAAKLATWLEYHRRDQQSPEVSRRREHRAYDGRHHGSCSHKMDRSIGLTSYPDPSTRACSPANRSSTWMTPEWSSWPSPVAAIDLYISWATPVAGRGASYACPAPVAIRKSLY